jgi:hydrogenase nickel incorporation protein HypB
MCLTCGCGDTDTVPIRVAGDVDHRQRHDHSHDHGPEGHSHSRDTLTLEERLLAKNDRLAGEVRASLAARGIRAVNLMSSPGSGKTSLLERTVADLGADRPICVIEGDQETAVDAERIARAGARAVQVNTGAGCHLDADMVRRAVDVLDPPDGALLFVENVGNLVCPALFDIGEAVKVVIVSVTEGDDKPVKYPYMFGAADLVIVNKTDLLPYVAFDVDRLVGQARSLSPAVTVATMSVKTGAGMSAWYAWLDVLAAAGPGEREGAEGGAAVRT